MTKESGVYQRHTRHCPRTAGKRGYAPHRCTGTWSYVIDVGRDAKNERRQETKGGFPTKKDAVEQRRKRLGELRTRTGEAHGTTVAAYLEQWLSWKRGLRDTTRVSYRGHLDHYLIPALGQYRLVDLERRPELIEEWVSSLAVGMKGKPLAPASVRRIYSTLRSALNSAVKRRMLSHNPALTVELPETVHYRPVVWDAQQVGVFLDAIQGHRLYALFALTILTGLRRGEALGLRWEDVDYDQGVLYVRQQVTAAGREIKVCPPKTKAGERTVALSEATVALLRQHQARQRRERLQWGEAWHDTGLVFTYEDGRMVRPDSLTYVFRKLATDAGLPRIRLHNLRHTSASLALAAGVPMKVVSERLGHSRESTTSALYTVVVPAVARDAAERIASVVPLPVTQGEDAVLARKLARSP
ncbi:MAG TPA: tyrosine-type recombinase/integrase [Frankiaceae bacterium]|nr:tyrosine-type recombinase/integrase [Frankiaceae bacterium]